MHLLLTASFKETKWRDTTIKKGQLVTSYKRLADDLGFTVQQVRTALKKLESTGEVTSKSTNKYTLITLVNWGKYQFDKEKITNEITSNITNEQQTNNKQITNKQQTTNNIVRNIKNVNNDKNDKNIDPRLAADLAAAGIGYDEYLRIKNQ